MAEMANESLCGGPHMQTNEARHYWPIRTNERLCGSTTEKWKSFFVALKRTGGADHKTCEACFFVSFFDFALPFCLSLLF